MKLYYNKNLKELARQLRKRGTNSEVQLWKCLRKKQLGYDFHRQKPIGNYIVDFYCPCLKLAIELDGYSHQFDKTRKKDKDKEEYLTKLGIKVLRFTDEQVLNNTDGVLKEIAKAIRTEDEHTSPCFA